MSKVFKLIQQIDQTFSKYKNLQKASKMSAYMKGKFDYFGISSPKRRELQADFYTELNLFSTLEKRDFVRELWQKNEREFLYFAIDFLKKWKKNDYLEQDIEFLQWLITQQSWWDSVDLIASNLLSQYFLLFPKKIEEIIPIWRASSNLWLNRSCLIFQLKYKDKVDFNLLKSLIVQFQDSKEFFIQKAIGWSLRSYSCFAPEEVKNFVTDYELKGLAKREALRKLM